MTEHPGVWFAIGFLGLFTIGALIIVGMDYYAEHKMKSERRKDLARRRHAPR